MSKKQGRLSRPKFGRDDWDTDIPEVQVLQLEFMFDYYGKMQIRVTDLETGKVTLLVEPSDPTRTSYH